MIQTFSKAPINLFFDCTPIGRILNKFSRDLSTLETEQYWQTRGIVDHIYDMSSTFIVGIIAFPWIGIGIPFFILFAHLILSYSTRALRETTRLTATSNSPVISYVGESVSGSSTIRAF